MSKFFTFATSACMAFAMNLAVAAAPSALENNAEMPCVSESQNHSTKAYYGSLEANVRHIIRHFPQWKKVVWDAPNDYLWVSNVELTGADPQDILNQLLAGYPVQAVFWHGNSTVQIKARNQ